MHHRAVRCGQGGRTGLPATIIAAVVMLSACGSDPEPIVLDPATTTAPPDTSAQTVMNQIEDTASTGTANSVSPAATTGSSSVEGEWVPAAPIKAAPTTRLDTGAA